MPIALPSLGDAVAEARRTLRRFPFAILAAVVAATANILLIEQIGVEQTNGRLMATAALGLPLFTALTLLAERLRRRGAWLALNLAGVAVLAGFFAGSAWWSDQIFFSRFVQCAIVFHLLVVLVPFVRRRLPNAFWQFSLTLLMRGVLATAFSIVLFAGLALALAAVKELFGVDVPQTAWARVWSVITFVFSSWFFLGGVPEDVEALEAQRYYPVGVRVLAQYILVPLASSYLVILTLYLGKVVVTWDWPSGWIGYLVSGVAAAGILAVLLGHPATETGEQRWVATFTRQFWFAILPAVAMLWLALYQRIHQYGFTEPRYFLLVLSVWLAALAVFYAVTRSRNIAVIPASLACVALATFAGPWSGFALSEGSQVRRLRAALERGGLLAEGALRPAPREVSAADRDVVNGTVRYLVAVHGTDAIAPWFADTTVRRAVIAAGVNGRVRSEEVDRWADTVVTHIGLRYRRPQPRSQTRQFAYQSPAVGAVPLRGFDYLVPIRRSTADTGYAAAWTSEPLAVRVTRGAETLALVPLDSLFARIRAADADRAPPTWDRGRRQPPLIRGLRPAMFAQDAAGGSVRVVLDLLEGTDSAGVVRVEKVTGRVLVAVRR